MKGNLVTVFQLVLLSGGLQFVRSFAIVFGIDFTKHNLESLTKIFK